MRTLTLTVLVIFFSLTVYTQPFFIDDEPKYSFVKDSSGTWKKVEYFEEMTIEQPQDLVVSKDEMIELVSGNIIKKEDSISTIKKFSVIKGYGFQSTRYSIVKAYRLIGNEITEINSSLAIKKYSTNEEIVLFFAMMYASIYFFVQEKKTVAGLLFVIILAIFSFVYISNLSEGHVELILATITCYLVIFLPMWFLNKPRLRKARSK